MPSVLYYPTGDCGGTTSVPQHTCSPCPSYENGRIRHGFFYRNSFTFISPENKNEWLAGLASGDIQLLWGISGSYDGGTITELPGFGDVETTNGGTIHIATIKDPNYYDNCDFYNAMRDSQDWRFGYVTENYIHLSGAPVTVSPKNPIADDLKSIVTWEASIKWSNSSLPCPYNKPTGIFDRCMVEGLS